MRQASDSGLTLADENLQMMRKGSDASVKAQVWRSCVDGGAMRGSFVLNVTL